MNDKVFYSSSYFIFLSTRHKKQHTEFSYETQNIYVSIFHSSCAQLDRFARFLPKVFDYLHIHELSFSAALSLVRLVLLFYRLIIQYFIHDEPSLAFSLVEKSQK